MIELPKNTKADFVAEMLNLGLFDYAESESVQWKPRLRKFRYVSLENGTRKVVYASKKKFADQFEEFVDELGLTELYDFLEQYSGVGGKYHKN